MYRTQETIGELHPTNWQESYVVSLYKDNWDVLNTGNHRRAAPYLLAGELHCQLI